MEATARSDTDSSRWRFFHTGTLKRSVRFRLPIRLAPRTKVRRTQARQAIDADFTRFRI